ncbi:hypothetical protein VPAL9027_00372 [Vibrio palustris]|uniref:Uncharacterized protein n=1 Tax=Vibrio palustris TaxID=1918946 RepID=A0A1R4B0J6_9VIBR|nr:hypothetical protein VPAL9027_00367 [Vibrio palustris]SJL82444.1 hypothetical protein VPAL9027_00372 [Vibrio palustris]
MSRSNGRKRIWFQHSQDQKIKKDTPKMIQATNAN